MVLACSRYLLQLYPCVSVKASVGCIAVMNQVSDDSTSCFWEEGQYYMARYRRVARLNQTLLPFWDCFGMDQPSYQIFAIGKG